MSLAPLVRYLRRHHVALLALFVALGGVSYAAVSLPKNSVGPRQLKKGAVTKSKLASRSVDSSKIIDGSLQGADFAANQLPAGSEGQRGPEGPRGERGERGETGGQGAQGPAGPFPDVLPSGKTIYGSYAVADYAAAAGEVVQDGQSYTFRLATDTEPVVRPKGAPPTAECPGDVDNPRAAPGFLCVYTYVAENLAATGGLGTDSPGTNAKTGFAVQIKSAAAGLYIARGTWAVTAA
jgi:hypothetical protein